MKKLLESSVEAWLESQGIDWLSCSTLRLVISFSSQILILGPLQSCATANSVLILAAFDRYCIKLKDG
jgi:hypothetical protein